MLVSHILQHRLSIEKIKSLSLCHLISLMGNSYRWSFTNNGLLDRISYSKIYKVKHKLINATVFNNKTFKITCPVEVPTAKLSASLYFSAVMEHFFSAVGLKSSNSESREQLSAPICRGARGSQLSTIPSVLPHTNNSCIELNSQQLYSVDVFDLSELWNRPCSKLNLNISSLEQHTSFYNL